MREYEDIDTEWTDMFSEDVYTPTQNKRKPKCYPTALRGRIKNGKTGKDYACMQGSYEELRYYKVIDSRGVYNTHGYKTGRKDPVNKDPVILYYDSPNQYMQHMNVELTEEDIQKWYQHKSRMFPDNGIFVKQEWENIKSDK
uniref:Uncharacterized protein n=1 Tax=viral metagenome TaxID=1070528 RepID=A0A6C0JUV5_9ZZZZ